uniref:Uncharacterized protein n=1 Tax=Rhizophora mucronata TaxID=61149 RepID=A0A2P2QDT8_RHIMU
MFVVSLYGLRSHRFKQNSYIHVPLVLCPFQRLSSYLNHGC